MTKSVLITGGAGFIGSNLLRALLAEDVYDTYYVFDNLSSGLESNLPKDSRLKYFNIDLFKPCSSWPSLQVNTIYHLAANADVRGGVRDRDIDFNQNVVVTKNVCDYARIVGANSLIFSSSATVYGEPSIFPTPENHPLAQTSIYGASKACGESIIQAYSSYGDFKSTIFRFVSWTGPFYSHGVIKDLFTKLKTNTDSLEILGDGHQEKSFLDVRDGVRALIDLPSLQSTRCEIFNLGHSETIQITDLAKVLCDHLHLSEVRFKYTGGQRGWIGDSPLVLLDIRKAAHYSWSPVIPIELSIRDTIDSIVERCL